MAQKGEVDSNRLLMNFKSIGEIVRALKVSFQG